MLPLTYQVSSSFRSSDPGAADERALPATARAARDPVPEHHERGAEHWREERRVDPGAERAIRLLTRRDGVVERPDDHSPGCRIVEIALRPQRRSETSRTGCARPTAFRAPPDAARVEAVVLGVLLREVVVEDGRGQLVGPAPAASPPAAWVALPRPWHGRSRWSSSHPHRTHRVRRHPRRRGPWRLAAEGGTPASSRMEPLGARVDPAKLRSSSTHLAGRLKSHVTSATTSCR